MTPERSAVTGGRDAYETTALVTLPNGSEVHHVFHLVRWSAKTSQLFFFETDGPEFSVRYAELEGILKSLRYAKQ